MTQEEKQLLLKDLSARLSYGVKVKINSKPRKVIGVYNEYVVVKGKTDGETSWDNYGIEEYNIKPYLRPLSSMTDEEEESLREDTGLDIFKCTVNKELEDLWATDCSVKDLFCLYSWLNEHHFDYNGLIEKGLALEAPDGMYEKI